MSQSVKDMPEKDDVDLQSAAVSPGQALRQAREAAKLSISDVADELHISGAYVRALEEGDYAVIPSETFVVGYLKSYARIVALDGVALVDAYRSASRPSASLTEETSQGSEIRETGRPLSLAASVPKVGLLAGAGVLLLLVLVALAWLIFSSDEEAVPATTVAPQAQAQAVLQAESADRIESPQAQSLDSLPESATEFAGGEPSASGTEVAAADRAVDQAVENGNATGADATDGNAEQTMEAAIASVASTVDTGVASGQPVSDGLDQLGVLFSAECWFEVIDARGDVLITDLYQAGASVNIEGEAPFRVVIGDVEAISLTLNGEPLTLQKNGDRKALRTTIGQSPQ